MTTACGDGSYWSPKGDAEVRPMGTQDNPRILGEHARNAESFEEAVVGVHVLVAAAGEVEDDEVVFRHFGGALN